MEPHRCYITGVAAVRFKRSTLCITKFRKHGTTPPVTFVPGPMKNVIARCFKPFDRVERSERERSSIPNLFLSLSLSLCLLSFLFLTRSRLFFKEESLPRDSEISCVLAVQRLYFRAFLFPPVT